VSDGEFGELPDWYVLLRAARYLNVQPWELLEQPSVWMEYALHAEYAESEATTQISKRK
jgi:hypothetical protein